MKRIIIITCILFSTSIQSQVYRSVDKDGNVVYSDEPSQGAQEVEVKELETVRSLELPSQPDSRKKPEPAPAYSHIEIINPADDTPLRDNAGNVEVIISLAPELRNGHSMVLYLDGQEYAKGRLTSFKLENIDRGTHQLRASVVDAQDRQQIATKTTTFHLQRFSAQH